MEPFRYHVFVCTQEKPEGVPCCAAGGSAQMLDALRRELGARGLADEVQVSTSGCLGTCEHGPVMIAYPEGVWYSELKPADVAEIVASHFDRGQPVSRLARSDAAGDEGGDPRSSQPLPGHAEGKGRGRVSCPTMSPKRFAAS